MTKEVDIRIKGQQLGEEEDPVIMTASGTYHLTNGNHYIHYVEEVEGSDDISKNTIKISSKRVILLKKGVQNSQMIFDLQEEDQAIYQTSYGRLTMETDTRMIKLQETQDRIEVQMEYSLFADGSKLSDNRLSIVIIARKE